MVSIEDRSSRRTRSSTLISTAGGAAVSSDGARVGAVQFGAAPPWGRVWGPATVLCV